MRRLVAILVLLLPGAACADDSITAASLIPFDSLTATNRALVRSVMDHCTLRRLYPTRQFKGHTDEFEWLLSHMEACSVLAEKTGLITYRCTLDAEGRLHADNREGAKGYMLVAYSSATNCVFYVEGSHRGIFTARGRGVAVVTYSQKTPRLTEYRGAVFVRVDNTVFAALARLFGIFLRGAVDKDFEHVIGHPVKLCELAMTDPQKVVNDIAQMPEQDRTLLLPFADLVRSPATNVAQSARLR